MRRLLAAPVLLLALAACGSSHSGASARLAAGSSSGSAAAGEIPSCAVAPASPGGTQACIDASGIEELPPLIRGSAPASPPAKVVPPTGTAKPTSAPDSPVTHNPPCCKSTGGGGSSGSGGATTTSGPIAAPPNTGGGTDSHIGGSCDPDLLTMTLTATSSGHDASFTAVLTNHATQTCTVTEGAGTPGFTVSNASGQVWAQSCDSSVSGHTGPLPCPDYARLQDLAPGGSQRFTQDWDGTADGNPVKAAPDGSYAVSAFVGGASGKAGFNLS